MEKWIQSCLFGSRFFAQNPVFLLAGELLFDEKIHQSDGLFRFGLRDVGILYSRAVIHRTIDVSLTFLGHSLVEKIAVWTHMQTVIHTSRIQFWIQFCMKRLRTLNSNKIFKIKNKKLKTYSGWCPFQCLSNGTTLMHIQSGRTVPLMCSNFANFSKSAGPRSILRWWRV